jgi:hypothetical protein
VSKAREGLNMEPSFTERADYYELEHAARLGVLLPAASVRALEAILPLNPADIVNRARLLGHYWNAYKQLNEESRCDLQSVLSARTKHILWFVENAPDCVFAGDNYLSCHAIHDKVNYERVKGAWEKQVESRHDSAKTVNFIFSTTQV